MQNTSLLTSVTELDNFIKAMIGSRKSAPPSSLLQELGKSNTVGGGLFVKKYQII